MAALVQVVDEDMGVTEGALAVLEEASRLIGTAAVDERLDELPPVILERGNARSAWRVELRTETLEHGFVVTMARPGRADGTTLRPRDVRTVRLDVVDEDGVQVAMESPAIEDVLGEELRTDLGWYEDRLGWTFRHVYEGRALRMGGRRYFLEYGLQGLDGERYEVSVRVDVHGRFSLEGGG